MTKSERLGGLLAGLLAGLVLWVGYQQRSFAWVAVAVAVGLVAVALWVRVLRGSLTVVISLLVAVALGEWALGLVQRSSEITVVEYGAGTATAGQYWSPSPLGASPLPGVHRVSKRLVDGESIYDAQYTIGANGFRVTPGAGAGPGRTRVNFLGCSAMFGEGLNDNQALPALMQARLPQIDAHSLAVSGYGMHQALMLMEDANQVPGKVNVVITAPWHSERSACVSAFSTGSPRYQLQPDGGVVRNGVCGVSPRALDRVLSWSNAWTLTKTLVSHKRQDAEIDLYLGLLRRMAALSKERGQAMVVGYWDAQSDWFTGSYNNAKVMDAIRAMGVEVVNLNSRNGRLPPELMLHRLDEHPNAKGVVSWADLLEKPLAQALNR